MPDIVQMLIFLLAKQRKYSGLYSKKVKKNHRIALLAVTGIGSAPLVCQHNHNDYCNCSHSTESFISLRDCLLHEGWSRNVSLETADFHKGTIYSH